MTKANSHSHQNSPGMHYTLLASLIISNITVLLLGVLFSQSMGSGLGEIASLGYYRDIAETQRSFARSTSLDCVNVDMRKFRGAKRSQAEKVAIRQRLRDSTNELRKAARSIRQKGKRDFFSEKALQVKAQERKQILMELLHTDPEGIALGMLAPEDRSAINEIAPKCAETSVVLEGRLEIKHFDLANFADGYEEVDLVTTSDKRMRLLGPKRDERLISGTRVIVEGLQLDTVIAYGSLATGLNSNGDGITIQQQPAISSLTIGEQTPLVVGVNFLGQPQSTIATSAIDSAMNLVDQYYAEVSYGQSDFHGVINPALGADFLGWFDLQRTASCSGTSVEEVKALIDPLIDFNNYSHIVIIGNYGNCSWAGAATVGEFQFNTLDGTVSLGVSWIDDQYVNLSIVGHELGHNFGNGHASSMNCGTESTAPTGCLLAEYGDQYDIMGSSSYRAHFNSKHKEQMSWFSPSNSIEVIASGQYALTPLEVGDGNVKTLKIRRSQFDHLYVEYRQPIGFDVSSLTNTNIPNGALLHLRGGSGGGDSFLIDASPPFDVRNPALEASDLFVDPATGAAISVVSRSPSTLTLDVTLCKTDFQPPSLTITSPLEGEILLGSVTVAATASDTVSGNSGIDRADFYYSDISGDVLIATDTAVPYEAVLDTTLLQDGSYRLKVIAYDRSGQTCQATNNSFIQSINVFISNGDTEPPFVTISRPREGSIQPAPALFLVQTADNVGVARVEVYENNPGLPGLLASEPGDTFSSPIPLAEGNHTVYAVAYDLSNNSAASTPVSFTVDSTPPIVSIDQPSDGERVNGIITITASASDALSFVNSMSIIVPTGIPGQTQEIYWQGILPFSASFDTRTLQNGTYTIEARASDFLGNTASGSIQIYVKNPGPGGGGGGAGGKLQQREAP